MFYNIAFFLAALLLLAAFGFLLFYRPRREQVVLLGRHYFAGGTFLSALALFLPICFDQFADQPMALRVLDGFLIAVHNVIRLFVVDNDIATVTEAAAALPRPLSVAYVALGAVLYIVAPLLTVGFILSFVKNLFSYVRYFFHSIRGHVHVFPNLNEQSLALAASIVKRSKESRTKAGVVFTDVVDSDDEESYELLDKARGLNAILFRKDLGAVNLGRHRPHRAPMSFYLIEEDEAEKIRHASVIMKSYDFDNASLYIFSSSVQCRLLFDAKPETRIKVMRVNDIRSLIYHNLDLYGVRLFKNARLYNNNTISAVIVGLGQYGLEVLKTLTWYCQVQGFSLKIRAFEKTATAAADFRAMCPELMELNRNTVEGEAHYDIEIYGGVDADADGFEDRLAAIPDATYAFVCLGTDALNIRVAERVRMAYASINPAFKPDVETVVYDSNTRALMGMDWLPEGELEPQDKDDTVTGVKNYKGQAYRIHMIGDLDSFYSVDTVIDSPLVERGYEMHLRYALAMGYEKKRTAVGRPLTPEEKAEVYRTVAKESGGGFWQQDYNYRSSVAKALYESLRDRLVALGYLSLIGLDKPWDERTAEERLAIGTLEHVRWNAYMRIEGYRCGPRNDLAKRHPKLVSVLRLSDADLCQDA